MTTPVSDGGESASVTDSASAARPYASATDTRSTGRQLFRSESNRMLGGVCGGLAEFFGVDATLVRVAFVVLTALGGAGILLYPAMWIVVPTQSKLGAPASEVAREGWSELRGRLSRPTRR